MFPSLTAYVENFKKLYRILYDDDEFTDRLRNITIYFSGSDVCRCKVGDSNYISVEIYFIKVDVIDRKSSI